MGDKITIEWMRGEYIITTIPFRETHICVLFSRRALLLAACSEVEGTGGESSRYVEGKSAEYRFRNGGIEMQFAERNEGRFSDKLCSQFGILTHDQFAAHPAAFEIERHGV